MDSMRFNKLVDSVRMIRLSNNMNDLGGWEPMGLLQREKAINAIIEKFNMTRSGILQPQRACEIATESFNSRKNQI